jgi:hypothetical protein
MKVDSNDAFYHVYARGSSKQAIFLDQEDYFLLLNLLKRYLSLDEAKDKWGVPYPHLRGELELLCYCLMRNHFHFLVYQNNAGSMTRLMRGLMNQLQQLF